MRAGSGTISGTITGNPTITTSLSLNVHTPNVHTHTDTHTHTHSVTSELISDCVCGQLSMGLGGMQSEREGVGGVGGQVCPVRCVGGGVGCYVSH